MTYSRTAGDGTPPADRKVLPTALVNARNEISDRDRSHIYFCGGLYRKVIKRRHRPPETFEGRTRFLIISPHGSGSAFLDSWSCGEREIDFEIWVLRVVAVDIT